MASEYDESMFQQPDVEGSFVLANKSLELVRNDRELGEMVFPGMCE